MNVTQTLFLDRFLFMLFTFLEGNILSQVVLFVIEF